MGVNLVPTNYMDIVREVVTRPDIWERFSDGQKSETFYPTTNANNQWLLVFNDEALIGVIYVHCDTSISIGFHPYLLTKHRKHGREMMKAFYNWFLTLPDQQK